MDTMTLTIDAAPELMEAIAREAEREGLTPQEYALKAVARMVVAKNGQDIADPNQERSSPKLTEEQRKAGIQADARDRMRRLRALLDRWDEEDATDDPEELARRQREGDELQASLRANRIDIPQDPKLVALLEAMDG